MNFRLSVFMEHIRRMSESDLEKLCTILADGSDNKQLEMVYTINGSEMTLTYDKAKRYISIVRNKNKTSEPVVLYKEKLTSKLIRDIVNSLAFVRSVDIVLPTVYEMILANFC